MMKRLISMLLALMMLLGMATAENAAEDDWKYELVGRAIELVRQMDAQERGRLFEDTLNITEAAGTETPQPIERGMPQQAFISVNGADKSASVLLFALMMMDASADTDATDETENAYLRIVERTFAVSPEFGMDTQETSAAANLLYAGDAPEMGLLLLSYGENGAVLVRWFAENGCVCLTAIPAAHQATELTTDKLSELYAGEFEEVDLSCAVALAESEPHQPDEDTIRQLALQSAQEMQNWAALSGEQEGIIPWNTAETAVKISRIDYDASQMTAFEAQMQQCGKTETKFLDILSIALYPCDAHDASGLLYLRPRTGTPIVVAWQAMNGAVVMRSVYAPQDEEDDAWEQTAVINGIMTARKLVDMVSNDAFVDWQQWRKEDTIGDIDRLRSADVSRPTEVWICPDTLSNEWGAVTLRNNEMLTVTNQPHTLSLLLCFAPDALICVEISGGAEENDYSAHVPRYTKEEILHDWGDNAYLWDTANLPDTLDWVRSDVIFGDTAEKILRNYIVYDGDGGDLLNGKEYLLQVRLKPEVCESLVIPPEYADAGIQASWLHYPAEMAMNQLAVTDPEEEQSQQPISALERMRRHGTAEGVTTETDGWGMTVLIPETGAPVQMLWRVQNGMMRAHVVWMPSEQLRACETNEDLAALLNAQVPGIVLE